jgi:hypothetical protein
MLKMSGRRHEQIGSAALSRACILMAVGPGIYTARHRLVLSFGINDDRSLDCHRISKVLEALTMLAWVRSRQR